MTETTFAPPAVPTLAPLRPEFVRLPKPGMLCPFTGLSRAKLNELVLPTPANGNKPPVKSKVLRQRGATTGIRLIVFDSLIAFLHAAPDGDTLPDVGTDRSNPAAANTQ